MVSLAFKLLLYLVTLCTFPSSTLQACTQFTDMEAKMAKKGYTYCPQKDDKLYMAGFTRKQGTDDLRDFKTYICCQPPLEHRKKPYTCTSADWDMSFSRCVILKRIYHFIQASFQSFANYGHRTKRNVFVVLYSVTECCTFLRRLMEFFFECPLFNSSALSYLVPVFK